MANNIKSTNLPLILTGRGVKPTVPSNIRAVFGDDDFDVTSDLMVGQQAYNVDDDIWYYRNKNGIITFGQPPTTVAPDKVFILDYGVLNFGTSNNDFEYIKSTSIARVANAAYDLLVIKSPGTYVITSAPYLAGKTLDIEVYVSSKNLNKISRIVSTTDDLFTLYTGGARIYLSTAPNSDVYLQAPAEAQGTIAIRQEIEFMLTSTEMNEMDSFPIVPIKNLILQQPSVMIP